jgi:two-component system chemotaxis response regulator CheY
MAEQIPVLVVDDSPAMRESVVHILNDMHRFAIVEAVDGLDALTKVRQQTFSLVVTDINMPRMDGLKLTEMLRRDAKHLQVPIIIVTSENAAQDRQRAMALGASAYLLKPANTVDLTRTVEAVLPPATL